MYKKSSYNSTADSKDYFIFTVSCRIKGYFTFQRFRPIFALQTNRKSIMDGRNDAAGHVQVLCLVG